MSQKIHRPIFEAMPVALEDIFIHSYHADKVIERQLKSHKKWGSRDRKLFAESIYSIVRSWRKYVVQSGVSWKDFDSSCVSKQLLLKVLFLELQNQNIQWPHWMKPIHIDSSKQMSFADIQSIPDWLDEMGREQFKDQWPEVMGSLNQQAQIYLRANGLKTSAKKLVSALMEESIEARAVNESCVCLEKRANVFKTKAFKEGLFEVQDLGSQKIAQYLQAQPKDRVWDACAGAGGKSLALAVMMQNKGKIIASDIHEWKLNELKKRARRNSVDIVETRLIDPKLIKRMHAKIDRLLLDVPCSGVGVLRRNPDTKWKMSPARIKELLEIQSDILQKYSQVVKPGGVMVYATCSFLESENQMQIDQFLKAHPQWKLEAQNSILPQDYDCDAFYMARLLRQT